MPHWHVLNSSQYSAPFLTRTHKCSVSLITPEFLPIQFQLNTSLDLTGSSRRCLIRNRKQFWEALEISLPLFAHCSPLFLSTSLSHVRDAKKSSRFSFLSTSLCNLVFSKRKSLKEISNHFFSYAFRVRLVFAAHYVQSVATCFSARQLDYVCISPFRTLLNTR